jgi:hypothetical protein
MEKEAEGSTVKVKCFVHDKIPSFGAEREGVGGFLSPILSYLGKKAAGGWKIMCRSIFL